MNHCARLNRHFSLSSFKRTLKSSYSYRIVSYRIPDRFSSFLRGHSLLARDPVICPTTDCSARQSRCIWSRVRCSLQSSSPVTSDHTTQNVTYSTTAMFADTISGFCSKDKIKTRKLSNRKDDRAMRPMYGCPENCRESVTTPTATFPELFNGLLFRLSL